MKYLSYDYLAKQDKIRLRLKFNMSKKKRGVRTEPDIKSYKEFEERVNSMGLSKRNLASLLAGIIYDPLCLLSPYISYPKIAYRNVCKKVKDWDERIGPSETRLVIRTVEKLFKVQNVLLPRAAFLQGAKRYDLLLFFDTSDDVTNTSKTNL